MFRQIMRLAVAAAKVEIARRFAEPEPAPTPAPVAAPVAAPPAARPKWESPTFHVEALRSSTCPDCEKPKLVGSYRCGHCTRRARA